LRRKRKERQEEWMDALMKAEMERGNKEKRRRKTDISVREISACACRIFGS
jgi:hypothetical protein